MLILDGATAAALAVSLVASPRKTLVALRLAATRLGRILPAFLVMLVLLAVALTLVPQDTIRRLVGRESGALGVAIAALAGSVTQMPGFIAFPLSAALLEQMEGRGYQIRE